MAGLIISSNDALVSLGVITAGLLVLHGGRRIMREAWASGV